MDDSSVDVTITDPPYGEVTHKGALGKGGKKKLITFDSISDDKFIKLTKELVRVTKRWVVMFCEWRHAARLEEYGLPLVRLGIWVKPDGAPQFTGDRPATGWEAVAILHREGKKRWNGGGLPAVWKHNIVKNNNLNPTQKPLGLLCQWIRLFSDPGELVFDPFGGSGTTAVAAVREGRQYLIIEKEKQYYDLIKTRLKDIRVEITPRNAKNGLSVMFNLPKSKRPKIITGED
jgi:DNA modification methylase